jgi:Trypsin-co-occurring domain 1
MTHLIAVKIGNDVIYAEVDDNVVLQGEVVQGELEDAGEKVERITTQLADLGTTVGSTCEAIFNAVQGAVNKVKPDELTLELGLMLGGGAGVPFVAKGKAEANVGITMKWVLEKRQVPEGQSGGSGV